jgi:uncharacterized membrane protein
VAISFQHPLLLLFLPLLLYPVYLWYKKSQHLPRLRRNLIISLRVSLLLSLLLALAGLIFRFPLVNQSVVFVVDGSASFEKAREQAEEFINQALLSKKPDDKAAVVLFGQEARVDQPLATDLEFNHLESVVDRNYSNPGEGLKLGDALMPGDSLRRVVLISDGLENSGDLVKETEFLARKGVRVDVLPFYREDEPEAWVKSMGLPERLYPGERFNVTVNINSNVTTPMLLRIFQDGIVIGELNSQVNPGANSFSCSAIIEESGFHTFEALAEFNQDSIADNNVAHAFTMVAGSPTILVVEGLPGEASSIAAALNSLHINNRVISPYQFPGSIDELQRYAAVVLCNAPAQSFTTSHMEAINLAVQNMGMGLIMVGGDQSFGPGGYFKTPVEKALPVNMDLRGQKEIPSLGLVLVIDKSGSMSGEAGGYAKIDLAREAAIQATEVLGPTDQIGVLAFDSIAKWVVKMRKVDDLAAIQDDIATLRADGGTSIYPALALAYEALKDVDTKYKHIILLTDGQSATSGDYYYLTRRMEKAGITLSTVAVGDGADTGLLEILAAWGQGRYYFTNQADNIPRIFTKETITALRSYLVEAPFTPVKAAGSELLQGINAVPQLHGYVASSIKDSAQMVLASHRGDPVLAGWQYGLGRSVAFTSDAGNRWAANWVGWEAYNRFWGNIISWVLPRTQDGSLQMEAYIEGGKGYVKVESDYLTAAAVINQARIITPDLKSQQLDLQPVAPGIYAGNFKVQEPGVYLINVVQKKGDDVIGSVSGGAALSYSPEYNNTNQDESFLKQVAATGGGSIILEPGEAFADNLPPLKGSVELWPWLLILAVCLLPLDIAARRLNLQRAGINKVRTHFKGKSDDDSKTQSPTLSRLQQRKQAVKQQRKTLKADDGRGENSSLLASSNQNIKPETISPSSTKVNETEGSHLDTARLLKNKRKR